MEMLYNIEYEKDYYLTDEEMHDKEKDVDNENQIIIGKSLECMDEIAEFVNALSDVRIAQNNLDYDLHIEGTRVHITGTLSIFVKSDYNAQMIADILSSKHDFNISSITHVTDIS